MLLGDGARLQQGIPQLRDERGQVLDKGQVTLKVRVAEESASALIRFEVDDTGVGIEAEALARLFTAFEQADNSLTRRYGGTGLGLAITRKIAQQMDGDAGAEKLLWARQHLLVLARLKKGAPGAEIATTPSDDSVESWLGSVLPEPGCCWSRMKHQWRSRPGTPKAAGIVVDLAVDGAGGSAPGPGTGLWAGADGHADAGHERAGSDAAHPAGGSGKTFPSWR